MPNTIYSSKKSIPFTYRVTHINTGRWYYGIRYAKDCQPSDLWSTYFTSSKIIKNIIKLEGINAFTFEIRKIFNCPEKAKKWENKVLRKILKWPNVLNKNAWPAISKESQIKSHQTRSQIQNNGKTSYQNAAITWKLKENLIEPKSGLTYKEIKYLKMVKTKKANGTYGKSTNNYFKNNNPVYNQTIKEKMIRGLKLYYSNNDNHFKGKKHSEYSIKLMTYKKLGINNPAYDTVWITNGIINKRVKINSIFPENFYLGRTKHKKSILKEHTCPYCGLTGKGSNMKRYHFDNCKKSNVYTQ